MMIQIITSRGGKPCFPIADELMAHKVIMYSAPPTVRRKYHGTEYVVKEHYAPNARETAPQKLLRIAQHHNATI